MSVPIMSVPIWVASPIHVIVESRGVALLRVVATGHQIQVKDPEIGQVYLDTYVYAPDMFSLLVKFDANGVKSIEVVKE